MFDYISNKYIQMNLYTKTDAEGEFYLNLIVAKSDKNN